MLRAPPPLDTPLQLSVDDDGLAVLREGDTPVGEAKPSDAELHIPEAPSHADAIEATKLYSGLQAHALPECFVCGPNRESPDGLRIFPGKLTDDGPALSPWTPDVSHCDADGSVRSEILWAALDCPGYFGVAEPGEYALLGRMTGRLIRLPTLGEACVAMGWRIERDGRKLYAGSAVFGAGGDCCGVSHQVWIKPRQPKPPQ